MLKNLQYSSIHLLCKVCSSKGAYVLCRDEPELCWIWRAAWTTNGATAAVDGTSRTGNDGRVPRSAEWRFCVSAAAPRYDGCQWTYGTAAASGSRRVHGLPGRHDGPAESHGCATGCQTSILTGVYRKKVVYCLCV